jgi:hypothetical protein
LLQHIGLLFLFLNILYQVSFLLVICQAMQGLSDVKLVQQGERERQWPVHHQQASK